MNSHLTLATVTSKNNSAADCGSKTILETEHKSFQSSTMKRSNRFDNCNLTLKPKIPIEFLFSLQIHREEG